MVEERIEMVLIFYYDMHPHNHIHVNHTRYKVTNEMGGRHARFDMHIKYM